MILLLLLLTLLNNSLSSIFFLDDTFTLTDQPTALAFCEANDGELATMLNDDEMNEAIDLCVSADVDALSIIAWTNLGACWTGLTDPSGTELEHEWSSGLPTCEYGFDASNVPTSGVFPWAPFANQPNVGSEMCVPLIVKNAGSPHSNSVIGWWDRPCTAPSNFIFSPGIALCRKTCSAGGYCSCFFGAKINTEPLKTINVMNQRRCCKRCQRNQYCNSFDFDLVNYQCRLFSETFEECILESDENFVSGEIDADMIPPDTYSAYGIPYDKYIFEMLVGILIFNMGMYIMWLCFNRKPVGNQQKIIV